MPNKCCVVGCTYNYARKKNSTNSEERTDSRPADPLLNAMVKFPRDENLLAQWKQAVGREGLNYNNAMICLKHFSPHLLVKRDRSKKGGLRPIRTAVPDLLPQRPFKPSRKPLTRKPMRCDDKVILSERKVDGSPVADLHGQSVSVGSGGHFKDTIVNEIEGAGVVVTTSSTRGVVKGTGMSISISNCYKRTDEESKERNLVQKRSRSGSQMVAVVPSKPQINGNTLALPKPEPPLNELSSILPLAYPTSREDLLCIEVNTFESGDSDESVSVNSSADKHPFGTSVDVDDAEEETVDTEGEEAEIERKKTFELLLREADRRYRQDALPRNNISSRSSTRTQKGKTMPTCTITKK
eukprot:CFRG6049T1